MTYGVVLLYARRINLPFFNLIRLFKHALAMPGRVFLCVKLYMKGKTNMEIKKVVFNERWFRIKKDDSSYVFYAYPRRNKNQPVGNSRVYDTKEECYTGIENFIRNIIDNKIDSFNSKFIDIEERESKLGGYKYRYVCKDLQGEPIF